MILNMTKFFDVIVIGSGIAGLSAAVEAAKKGVSVAIVSSTHLFSGSSFYPGTWGFGLVGPEGESDQEDMIQTIHTVGCQMADPEMVKTFVSNINNAISYLETLGCHPKKASKGSSSDREYIPCFDHKHRNWNGLEFPGLKETFTAQLESLHIEILEKCTLLDLVKDQERVCGAVFAHNNELEYMGCKSLILATGGYGSLFKYHLCTDDVCGLGQFLALKAGCKLINMEFMQMMPGYLSPARNTIFNEKTFRFARFTTNGSENLFTPEEEAILDIRSMHGPFTCRLPSYRIDLKILRASLPGEGGAEVSYADATKNNPPEFIQIYFDWLEKEKHVSVNDTIHIGIFAHAANGGIRIDADCKTSVDGLFACGEATGGMHGADRIGGLSTANGLVFGQRAGRSAAQSALETPLANAPAQYDFSAWSVDERKKIRATLQDLMYQNAMIARNEKGLEATLEQLQAFLNDHPHTDETDVAAITDSRILEGQLMTAQCILKAALLRKESRGSHFREDFPESNSELAFPIELHWDNGIVSNYIRYAEL